MCSALAAYARVSFNIAQGDVGPTMSVTEDKDQSTEIRASKPTLRVDEISRNRDCDGRIGKRNVSFAAARCGLLRK
jgi:hypothetical protein